MFLQILFMVGKGYLRPDMSLCRNDTPKQLKRHMLECIQFDRDERPLFPQVFKYFVVTTLVIPHIYVSSSSSSYSLLLCIGSHVRHLTQPAILYKICVPFLIMPFDQIFDLFLVFCHEKYVRYFYI